MIQKIIIDRYNLFGAVPGLDIESSSFFDTSSSETIALNTQTTLLKKKRANEI